MKMQRISVRSLVGAVLTVLALLASGCSSTDRAVGPQCAAPPMSALVLVVGVHQGGSAPSVPTAAACSLEGALTAGVPISVVTAEGTPQLVLKARTWVLNDGMPATDNPQAYQDDLDTARSVVLGAVRTAAASSDHHDLMAALAIAADQGRQQSGSAVRIEIIDNGLSDTGVLSMAQPGMTVADPQAVAEFVKDRGGCPATLAGTIMTMYGAGYGVAPQEPLSSRQRDTVGLIWQAVIAACGGHLQLVSTPRTDSGPSTIHTVNTVASEPDPVIPTTPVGHTLQYSGDRMLRFNPDSTELSDPDAAVAALRAVAGYLTGDRSRSATITGTTSNEPTRWATYADLGRARAASVKALLVDRLGVSADQVSCVGLGYIADPPVVDPATSALNRSIRIHIDS